MKEKVERNFTKKKSDEKKSDEMMSNHLKFINTYSTNNHADRNREGQLSVHSNASRVLNNKF